MLSSSETHSNSALFKRADQLRRWEESDTNREPVLPKHELRKIKFSSGCVFLAACAAAEKDEVIRLIEQGADIDTANVDGLTALHQACIDDNLDMVEFLVEHGSDVNRGDNEGWTPLHATASCGFISIAKYLLEHGANVAAVNCDGELAVDIAETEQMEELLQGEIDEQGIDCDLARSEEKRLMMHDALDWFKSKSACVNESSPKTGATPLHVACAKGYVDVIKVLLQCIDVDIDKQDIDGWTPLHAAAHWGQREASQLLAEHLADMDSKNYVGQTAFDVADTDMYNHLEELRKAQNQEAILMRRRRKQGLPTKRQDSEEIESAKTPSKVQRLEKQDKPQSDGLIMNNAEVIEKKNRVNAQTNQNINENSSVKSTSVADVVLEKNKPSAVQSSIAEDAKKSEELAILVNKNREKDINDKDNKSEKEASEQVPQGVGLKPSKSFNSKDKDVNEVKLRKNYSFQNDPLFCERYREVRARIQATSSLPNATYNAQFRAPTSNYIIPPAPSVATPHPADDRLSPLRRHSNPTGSDGLSISLSAITNAHAQQSSGATSPLPSNPSMKISGVKVPVINTAPPQINQNGSQNGDAAASAANIGINRLTMIKNFFKSFVPPIRDEESETQRKAKAKKVRETRRSTQGVTLEEIKSAEQLVKNNQINNNNNENLVSSSSNDICVTATITQITTAAPTVANSSVLSSSSSRHGSVASLGNDAADLTQSAHIGGTQERRPSWRLRLDNGSKFKLEDAATSPTDPPSPTSDATTTTTANATTFVRRTAQQPATVRSGDSNATSRPNSAPVLTADSVAATAAAVTAEATVTLPLRSRVTSASSLVAGKTTSSAADDDRDQDKENDARSAHQSSIPTQAAIQRRKRSKRRSTGGVVQFEGLEQELEAERDNSGGGDCISDDSTKLNNKSESGGDRSLGTRSSSRNDLSTLTAARCENGEIDYKRLYELAIVDNDRLKDKLRKGDEELRDTKQTLERLNTVTSKNSLSELEKRERRAMERKLSEMEEELKHLDLLKTENQRLKDENGALIRVISKLSK